MAVNGELIVAVSPASQTVQPGGTTTYDVRLTNPTAAAVTYQLSVGLLDFAASDFSQLPSSVTVGPGATVDEPLAIRRRRRFRPATARSS